MATGPTDAASAAAAKQAANGKKPRRSACLLTVPFVCLTPTTTHDTHTTTPWAATASHPYPHNTGTPAHTHTHPTHLEGYAAALSPFVEHRPPAVAAVDGCVYLYAQQVDGAVGVLRHLWHDTQREGHMRVCVHVCVQGHMCAWYSRLAAVHVQERASVPTSASRQDNYVCCQCDR